MPLNKQLSKNLFLHLFNRRLAWAIGHQGSENEKLLTGWEIFKTSKNFSSPVTVDLQRVLDVIESTGQDPVSQSLETHLNLLHWDEKMYSTLPLHLIHLSHSQSQSLHVTSFAWSCDDVYCSSDYSFCLIVFSSTWAFPGIQIKIAVRINTL